MTAKTWLRAILAMIALAAPFCAYAELGGDVASVQNDQAHMKATLRVPEITAAYTRHEIEAPSGTVIREYVSPAGKVFAVTFQGPVIPDLKQTLGAYFDQYTREAQNKRAGRGPLRIQQTGLVVEISGHMRAFQGRAYVPELVPQGIPIEEIQ